MAGRIPDVSNEWDKDKLRTLMANAKRLGRKDVDDLAFRQLCRVEGRKFDDPLESEFASVMRALEEALTDERGKTTRLSRTRQKLGRVGVRQTLIDLALKPSPSVGFLKLLELGMADMSAEALILKHRAEFPAEVVEAARRRLTHYDIKLPGTVG